MGINDENKQSDFFMQTILAECESIINEQHISPQTAEEIALKSIAVMEEFSRPLIQLYKEVDSRTSIFETIITPELFLRIIKHLRKIANQRIESRNVGVNIIIFSQEERVGINGSYPVQFQPYVVPKNIGDVKDFFIDDSSNLQRIYKCIDSDCAFFAYIYDKERDELKFDGIRSFSAKSMSTICGEGEIGFQLSRGTGCIRIYNKHNKIVDYYVSEVTGDWVARFDSDILDVLNGLKMFREDDAKILSNIATEISYLGYGAMIIITSDSNKFGNNSAPCKIINEELEESTANKTVFNYASYDGAVIIECGKGGHRNDRLKICNFGVLINPTSTIDDDADYSILLNYTNSGSRHEKAVRYAYDHPEDCIIVISENRTISIMHGRSPLYWRDSINPNKLIHYVRKRLKPTDSSKKQ